MFSSYNIHLEIDKELGYINLFPFKQRWLRGEEYGFLCRHYYAYSNYVKVQGNFFKVVDRNHPEEIYHSPRCKFFKLLLIWFRRRLLFHKRYASLVLWISKAHLWARPWWTQRICWYPSSCFEEQKVQVEEDKLQDLLAKAQPSCNLCYRQY